MGKKLNTAQQKAVCHETGPMLVLAGPGSGKTTVLLCRISRLLERGLAKPQEILALTFSKAAAEEMKSRFENLNGASGVSFGTFHSIFFRILRSRYGWNVEQIFQEEERRNILRNSIEAEKWDIPDLEEYISQFFSQLSLMNSELEQPNRFTPVGMPVEEFRKLYRAYEGYKERHEKLDFDDMLIHALEVLDNPNMQAFWQRKYPYVCVDEAQDTSRLQHAIVQKLHRTGDSLFMVGDDDQSIYAFRGAMPEDMLTFDRRYEDAAVHRMGVNFRSDQQIVLSGDGLIQRNKVRAKKTMEAFSKQPGEIRIIDISAARQGQFLLDQARRFCKKQEGKENPESLAILYRNNVSALLPLAYFFKNDVPFVGNKVFDVLTLLYSRTAINILAFLRFVLEPDSFQAYSSAYPVWNHYHGLFLNRETAVENLRKQMGEENSGGPILPKLQALLRSLGEMDKARHIGEIWTILQRIQPHAGIQR